MLNDDWRRKSYSAIPKDVDEESLPLYFICASRRLRDFVVLLLLITAKEGWHGVLRGHERKRPERWGL